MSPKVALIRRPLFTILRVIQKLSSVKKTEGEKEPRKFLAGFSCAENQYMAEAKSPEGENESAFPLAWVEARMRVLPSKSWDAASVAS